MFEGIGVGVGRRDSPPIGVGVGIPYGLSLAGLAVEPVPVTDVGPELWQDTSARIAAAAQVGLCILRVYTRRRSRDANLSPNRSKRGSGARSDGTGTRSRPHPAEPRAGGEARSVSQRLATFWLGR